MSTPFRRALCLTTLLACASVPLALQAAARPGPDVVLSDITDVAHYGPLGGVHAYAIGSATCNNGDQNLRWTSHGTPALAMNAFRLKNGRLMQIGQAWCKTACCAAAGSGCVGSCNGQGGQFLGVGCRDVYGAGINGAQGYLAPRSGINAYTGAMTLSSSGTVTAVTRRLQIPQVELDPAANPGAVYFVDGLYVGTDDAANGNGLNNASYKRVTVTNYNMSVVSPTNVNKPGIQAWRDHGLGAGTPDPSVNVFSADVPNEGRFWIASKVTDLGDGRWLYDYAVYNMNSHCSGSSLSIPLPTGVAVTGQGFHDVDYHSGEPYSNTDWTMAAGGGSIVWSSPQTFAQNPDSNALRWGTMYNFWFEANTAPTNAQGTLGLFRPCDPQSISFEVPVPTGGCPADWNHDNVVNSADFFDFISVFFSNNADFNSDGTTDSQDFFDFVAAFFAPCP